MATTKEILTVQQVKYDNHFSLAMMVSRNAAEPKIVYMTN
jgi:hypothetical protein